MIGPRPWYTRDVRSMTGHGRGVAGDGEIRIAIEIRAVNHRFLDLKLRGGLDPAVWENVSARVRKRLFRGAVQVEARVHGGAASGAMRADPVRAKEALAALTSVATAIGSSAPIPLELVCAQPGVIAVAEARGEVDPRVIAAAGSATDAALDGITAMRDREGDALARDVAARVATLDKLIAELAEAATGAAARHAQKLGERIAKLTQAAGVTVDPGRVAQEVAVLADRLDVTEEIVRAKSHLEQLSVLLADAEPVGRRLEFLLQELSREVNTIAAKSQTAAISATVVSAKAELEKIREQAQNIE